MTEFGVVSNSEGGKTTVMFSRPEACAKCGACGSGGRKHVLEIDGTYAVGHWLRVEMPEGRFLTATSLAYALPLMMLLIGLVLGYFIGGRSDAGAGIGAGVMLLIAILLLRLLAPRVTRSADWKPKVTGEYEDKPTQADIGCGGAPTK